MPSEPKNLRGLTRRLTAVALAAVDPERLVRDQLCGHLRDRPARFDAILAVGKAAAALARGTRASLDPSFSLRRLLVRPQSSPALLDPGWEQRSGGHPLPDRQSVAAGERVRDFLAALAPGQKLLALISGGASACLELPAPGLTLDDLIATQRLLLASGLPIHTVNTVRKHLSALKGGGALRATSGQVLALILSDVPGDDPALVAATVASGLFAADPATFAEALAAVERLPVPEAVRRHLMAGARGELPETIKPGDPALGRVETVEIGSVRTAVEAVIAELRRLGYAVADGELTGEAAVAGRELVSRGRALADAPGTSGVALVLGGETTVTLEGEGGHGGRNQEMALAAARALAAAPSPAGEEEAVLTLATDGEDGPTRAAGGIVDGETWEAIRRAGGDPEGALERHDSGRALKLAPGALLETGVTGTNVGDLAVYLRHAPA